MRWLQHTLANPRNSLLFLTLWLAPQSPPSSVEGEKEGGKRSDLAKKKPRATRNQPKLIQILQQNTLSLENRVELAQSNFSKKSRFEPARSDLGTQTKLSRLNVCVDEINLDSTDSLSVTD